MKQIRIILKTGNEVTFEAEDGFSMLECKRSSTYHSPNGYEYEFEPDSIAAFITTPMIQCPNCGEWVIPEYTEVKNYSQKGAFIKAIKCPKCACRLDGIINGKTNQSDNCVSITLPRKDWEKLFYRSYHHGVPEDEDLERIRKTIHDAALKDA